jgi:acetolactate synthase-1/2/3 large subunit
MVNPDFVKLAESMHCKALRCTSVEDLPRMMKEFMEYDEGPIVMECQVTKNEHVFPMVAAGKALQEQVVHPLLREASETAPAS